MNYEKLYDNLIEKAKIREILEGYYEKHHIIPKCLGGSNSKDNLVKLTAREHFIAHLLLMKIFPSNHKLTYAAHVMGKSFRKKGGKSKLFEAIRKYYSKASSEYLKGKPRSEETKAKLRLWKGSKHHFFGKTREEFSKRISGKNNPMFGRCRKGEFAGEKNGMYGKGYLVSGKDNPMFKGFWITPLGKFGSCQEAAKIHNVSKNTISNRCKSQSETFKDWLFELK